MSSWYLSKAEAEGVGVMIPSEAGDDNNNDGQGGSDCNDCKIFNDCEDHFDDDYDDDYDNYNDD